MLVWGAVALGCGARTGLLTDADVDQGLDPQGAAGRGAAGAAGGASAGAPPLSTNCTLVGDDPRVAGIKPDQIASLDGADFVVGDVKSYHWTLQTEDCDGVVQNAQFKLQGVDSRVVQFQPSRPAFYHFTLEVTGAAGDRTSCKLEVPVAGVGMRVELCWDTSTSTDLDLYLHTPYDRQPWFNPGSTDIALDGLNNTTCNTSNATVNLRVPSRVDWGYGDSPLSACNTPSFEGFLGLGRCPNPRAADDNNHSIAIGTTERMQLDDPKDGQTFRVMVQNFDNLPAKPHVFVYCAGQRAAALDPPPAIGSFVASRRGVFGAMWRAADITTSIDATGRLSCNASPVGDRVLTVDDPAF